MHHHTGFTKLIFEKSFRLHHNILQINRFSLRFVYGKFANSIAEKQKFVSIHELDDYVIKGLFAREDTNQISQTLLNQKQVEIGNNKVILKRALSDLIKARLQGFHEYLQYYDVGDGNFQTLRCYAYTHAIVFLLAECHQYEKELTNAFLYGDVGLYEDEKALIARLLFSRTQARRRVYDSENIARFLTKSSHNKSYEIPKATINLITFLHFCSARSVAERYTIYYELIVTIAFQNPTLCANSFKIPTWHSIDTTLYEYDDGDNLMILDSGLSKLKADIEGQLGISIYKTFEVACITILEFRFSKEGSEEIFSRHERMLISYDFATGYIFSAKFLVGELEEFRDILRAVIEKGGRNCPYYMFYDKRLLSYIKNYSSILSELGVTVKQQTCVHHRLQHFLHFYSNHEINFAKFWIKHGSKETSVYNVEITHWQNFEDAVEEFPETIARKFNYFSYDNGASAAKCFSAMNKFKLKLKPELFASIFFHKHSCSIFKEYCVIKMDSYIYLYDLERPTSLKSYLLVDGANYQQDFFLQNSSGFLKATFRCRFIDEEFNGLDEINGVPKVINAREESSALLRHEFDIDSDPNDEYFNKEKSTRLRKAVKKRRKQK